MLGTDRIGHWEHVALTWIKGLVSWPFPEREREVIEGAGDLVEAQVLGDGAKKRILEEESRAEYKSQEAKVEVEDHGYREAEQANAGSNASTFSFRFLVPCFALRWEDSGFPPSVGVAMMN